MTKKRSRKKLCEEIKKCREEIDKTKQQFDNFKNFTARHNLESDYLKKKSMISNNIYLLRNKITVVHTLQGILYSDGKYLPINLNEWSIMLERLENLSEELDAEYSQSLNSTENCLSDIASKIDFPEDDITQLVQDAFDKLTGEQFKPIRLPNLSEEDQQYASLSLLQQQKDLERSLKDLVKEEKKNLEDWREKSVEIKKQSKETKFDFYDVNVGPVVPVKSQANNPAFDDSGIGLEERFDWFNDPIDEKRLEGPITN